MHVRDAVEADADALAAAAGLPVEALTQLIHDRTVVVAVRDDRADEPTGGGTTGGDGGDADGATAGGATGDAGGEADPLGFLAFDALEDAVHVTQLCGDRETVGRLLEEPTHFAANEGMAVEVLVPASETDVLAAVDAAGFEPAGSGPRFDGEPTRLFRLEPEG